MIKLILCLVCGLGICIGLLQLRQQRLEIGFQNNRLYRQIEQQQSRLWQQQLEVAACTAPNTIRQTIARHEMSLVPQFSPRQDRRR